MPEAMTPQHQSPAAERFLAYLPHSGFNNQRIALENALLLAYALRRTLLVPPIRLGNKPIRYVEYDTLIRHHEISSKAGLQHCLRVHPGLVRPPECFEYSATTLLPWSWLFDVSALEGSQRMIHLPSMSPHLTYQSLDISEEDIYVFRDASPYQYRFLDTDQDTSPPSRYSQDVFFSELESHRHKLLSIGTMFGSSRLHLRNPDFVNYRQKIRKTMVFAHKDLISVANSISRSLGQRYISIHLRTGDGHFGDKIDKTVNSVWRMIVQDVLGLDPSCRCYLESRFSLNLPLDCPPSVRMNCLPVVLQEATYAPSSLHCRSSPHSEQYLESLNVALYVATDLRNPDTHPSLRLFRRTFPCIFFLVDFPNAIQQLGLLKSPSDGVPLEPFLLSFVDAMVAAKGLRVVGTQNSTFSKYVTHLWKEYH